MRVGLLTASLSRNAGGIYDSMRFLARDLLQANDFDLQVFGLKDEHTIPDRCGWGAVHTHAFNISGPRAFGFAPSLLGSVYREDLDLLHSNGLWMYPSLACLRWAATTKKPYIVSPHGMLDPWAMRQSRWKKRFVSTVFQSQHLSNAACIHALGYAELETIRAYGLKNPVCVIPNGVELPICQPNNQHHWNSVLKKDSRVILYLGRLHPKKGLRNLLYAWKQLCEGFTGTKSWILVIAGWDQGGHEQELKSLASNLEITDSVIFVGSQFDNAKHSLYERADAFVLPSYSEGLPMVILEAWSHNLPVLMTKQCNLPEGFVADAAIEIAPDVQAIANGLFELFNKSDRECFEMGLRGLQLIKHEFTWKKVSDQMLAVYRWVLGLGPVPDCVEEC